MPNKKHRPEEIIGKLHEAEVALAQGPRLRRRLARGRDGLAKTAPPSRGTWRIISPFLLIMPSSLRVEGWR